MEENTNPNPANPLGQNPGEPPKDIFEGSDSDQGEKDVLKNFVANDSSTKQPTIDIQTMRDDLAGNSGKPIAEPVSTPVGNATPKINPEVAFKASQEEESEQLVIPAQTISPNLDTNEPVFTPEADDQYEDSESYEEGKGKKIFIIVGVVLGIIILVLIGYFLVIPLLFPPLVEPSPQQAQNTEPLEPLPPVETVTPTPEVLTHKSLFLVPPTEIVEIELPNSDYQPTTRAFLGAAAADKLIDNSIKEIVLKINGSQLKFSEFLSNFSKTGASPFINDAQFEDDFTAFLYYDKDGVWPGYIAKLKSGQDPAQTIANLKSAEPAINTDLFYLTAYSAGTLGEFKDGKANEVATRYSVGEKPGAAFNYGVFGDKLVISTSYQGLLRALIHLGS